MPLPPAATDRTCLVTGASSGIGAEIARELARRGRNVTIVARREDRLRTLADELVAAHGVRADVRTADLTDQGSRAALVDAIAADGLGIDVLVNNAGFSTSGPVASADVDREISMIRTDVEAVAALCTMVVPQMATRRTGGVLNVASTAAFQPLPGQAGYGASKAFVLSYSQALRAELRGRGVTVTVLCPGPVRTEFAEAAGFTDAEAESAMPSFMWMEPAQVAREALDGLDRGRAVVIPGPANKVTAWSGHLVPRSVLLPVLARQHPALKRT